jgi:hypothetical protein
MSIQANRRSFIAGTAATAVAVAIPASAIAAATDRSAWEFALRAYEQAQAEWDAYASGFNALYDRCKAACEQIPHVNFGPDPYLGLKQPVTTANRAYVQHARRTVQDLDAGKIWLDPAYPDNQAHYQLQRAMVEAAGARDADVQVVRDSYGMDEAEKQYESLGETVTDAAASLMATPSPDLAALRWKLDYLTDGGWDGWEDDYTRQTLADIARLLPPAV